MHFYRPGRKCHFQSSLHSQHYALLSVWNARRASGKWMGSDLGPPNALAINIWIPGRVEEAAQSSLRVIWWLVFVNLAKLRSGWSQHGQTCWALSIVLGRRDGQGCGESGKGHMPLIPALGRQRQEGLGV